MGAWRVAIPHWHPTSLNTLMEAHWRDRARFKRKDREMIRVYCLLNHVPPARGRARRVTLTYGVGRGGTFPDDDNLRKSLLDALVANGVLHDDSPRWCMMPPVRYERGDIPMTILDIEDFA
jgi:hypothetical protein